MGNKIPTFDEIIAIAPEEIQDLLAECGNTPQGKNWHPEGDVLKHTKIVYNRARKTEDLNIVIAALFHDLGKVKTTRPSKKTPGGFNAYGHEYVSAKLVKKHRRWIGSTGAQFMKVMEIVENHMKIKLINSMRSHKQKALREHRVYKELLKFTDCDNMKTLTDEELKS